MKNRTLLEKADLLLADITAGGGVLQPAQAQKFIRLIIKNSMLMGLVTVTPMSAPKMQFPKIKFASRILRPGSEAVPVAAADRSRPEVSFLELNAELFKGEVQLTDEVLEDNIERGDFRQTVMDLIAEAVARDMEEIVIRGDKTSPDPFLARFDGVLAKAKSHVVDAAGQPLSKALFTDLLKVLPSEYLRQKTDMRFFTGYDAELGYRDKIADRATVLGDRYQEGDENVVVSGVPLVPVPLFPENLGPQQDQTNVLFTHPKNIVVGVWRQVRMETDRDISTGVLKIVVTLRFTVELMDELATAKAVGVKAS
jgi:hypothetical protein